ncbi:MAG: phosphotransferase [Chloroflexota bacterium]|nr:phosphotransferase [Chloroflexota bacterium]
MKESKGNKKLEQIVRRLDPHCELLRTWQLEGGVSAQVTVLEIERPNGRKEKVIVRRHGDADLKRNPNVAADEFKLLQVLQSEGLAVPKPYLVDQSGEILAAPYIVTEYLEGTTEDNPANLTDGIFQLATQLVKIHEVDGSHHDLSFLPVRSKEVAKKLSDQPERLDASLDEGRIRKVLAPAWPLSQLNQSVLLHGDFWPGNTLWKAGQLVAVIDWEDAALGDPLADLANGRLEILWAFGMDAMHEFTNRYKSMTTIDFTNLPYWDLVAALRPASRLSGWGLAEATEKRMIEAHRLFVSQAFEKLSIQ